MAQRLKGKRALVTAAANGIGKATAELFAAEGAEVLATDIDAGGLANVQNCRTQPLDVLDPSAISRLAESEGAVDILFNCAGYVHHGTILDCDEDAWTFSNELNVKAMYRMCRAFLPAMIDHGSSSIVNMSSVAGAPKGIVNRFVYGTTKAAVIGLTKSIAIDFVAKGIRCNAICPGTVETPSLEQRIRDQGDYDAAKAAFIARQPMGRLGQAQEIANLALYLASDESGYTTGTVNIIDGGICC